MRGGAGGQRTARRAAESVADKATASCLDRANEHQDEETGYVGYVADFDGSREWCALWANHVKNPRKKTIDFPGSAGKFAAELPKQVLTAAVAMRARRTAVDAHSELCANELMAVSGAGILSVDLLSLPPLATTRKGWTVKPRSSLTDAVERVRYPIPRPDDDDDDARGAAPRPRSASRTPYHPRSRWWTRARGWRGGTIRTESGPKTASQTSSCVERHHRDAPRLLHYRPRAVRGGTGRGWRCFRTARGTFDRRRRVRTRRFPVPFRR